MGALFTCVLCILTMLTTIVANGDQLTITGDPEFVQWAEELIATPEFKRQCEELDAYLAAQDPAE